MTLSVETVGIVLALGIIIGFLFLLISYIFVKGILLDYRQMETPMTINELYDTVQAVMHFEIEVLEKDRFQKFGNNLNNQSFDNCYHYLTRQIIGDFSKAFLYRASFVMSEEAIVELICKNVINYLKTKLASGAPTED